MHFFSFIIFGGLFLLGPTILLFFGFGFGPCRDDEFALSHPTGALGLIVLPQYF